MRFLWIFMFSMFAASLFAGEIEINGSYQGDNLYVQNPYAESGVGFCVFEVMVNGQTTTDEINSSSFEVDLSVFRFAIGEPVQVVIKYKEGCEPAVINPEVLAPRASFKTIDIAIHQDNLIWKTNHESGTLPFIVEQYRWNKWVQVGSVNGKGVPGTHEYSISVRMHSGENRFRVRQTDHNKKRQLSPEVVLEKDKPAVSLASMKVEDSLVFSEPTLYEIYDIQGRIVFKGYDDSVSVQGLDRGEYYLNFDNQMSVFTKQ
ncbi:hypothetical protein [Marinilabilia salmonicolor]|uniref:hypothetical protein n=1 Tax=Marinilabilia salmonicolor TaxID=989 RepID=UPI00029A6417|nr:hypothetical protein [Marinilabilia salmonicolor]